MTLCVQYSAATGEPYQLNSAAIKMSFAELTAIKLLKGEADHPAEDTPTYNNTCV
jgi:hypothetical protein